MVYCSFFVPPTRFAARQSGKMHVDQFVDNSLLHVVQHVVNGNLVLRSSQHANDGRPLGFIPTNPTQCPGFQIAATTHNYRNLPVVKTEVSLPNSKLFVDERFSQRMVLGSDVLRLLGQHNSRKDVEETSNCKEAHAVRRS